jgi:hypothetical protein
LCGACLETHNKKGPKVQSRKITTHKPSPGRPPGRKPRPHIQIEGDTLVPKNDAAAELGVSVRTISRMRPPTTVFGGVAYVAMGKLRAQIADGLSSPKKRGRR